MQATRLSILLMIFSAALCAQESPRTIPLRLQESADVARKAWPVSGGIPFPKGVLKSTDAVAVIDAGGKAVPVAVSASAKWPDGSVKWLLVDFQADLKAGESASWLLKWGKDAKPAALPSALKVSESAVGIAVETGAVKFTVAKNKFVFLDGFVAGLGASGKSSPTQFLDYQSEGPQLNEADSGPLRGSWKRHEKDGASAKRLSAEEGAEYTASVEFSNSMRAVIRCEGWFGGGGDKKVKYVVRYEVYAGRPYVKVQHTFVFTENPDSFFLRRLALRLPIAATSAVFGGGEGEKDVDVKVADGGSAYLLSLGPQINHNGILLQDAAKQDVLFDIFSGAKEPSKVASGKHASGFVTAMGAKGGVTVAVRDFWRLHPKELSVDADGLTAWLMPDHGGMTVDMRNPLGFNAEPEEGARLGGRGMGSAKTHELLVFRHGSDAAALAEAAAAAKAFQEPIWPYVSPEWNCASEAMGCLHPYDPKDFPGMEGQLDVQYRWLEVNQRLFHWDGLFDYGDFLIEFDNHGQRNSSGSPANTWVWRDYAGWLNEDGQQTHHLWREYFRTGRRGLMRMAEAMTRKISDVNTCHYVNPAFNDGEVLGAGHRHDMTPWHSFQTGYGSAFFGTVDLYYFTGDLRAKECLRDNAVACRSRQGIKEIYSFPASLARIGEALGDQKMLDNSRAQIDQQRNWALGPTFRCWSDYYPMVMLQYQILEDKRIEQDLLAAADQLPLDRQSGEVFA